MKQLITCLLALSTLVATAGPNDTTTVLVHDAVDMTWYGNYDVLAELPDGSTSYRQILMHYTMGCASNGCSDWDYTSIIELMDETGVIDSTLRQAPSFKVNNQGVDSILFAIDTTYTTFYTPGVGTDSAANAAYLITLYQDLNNPTVPTDTVYYWPGDYYNLTYDTSGTLTGSQYVGYDSLWYPSYTPYYTYYEVINRIELGRVITPYGGYMANGTNGFNNNWSHKHTFDVTDYVHLLKDSIKLRAFYSGWSSGFSATIEFDFIEGTPLRNVQSVQNLYKGYYNYTDPVDFDNNVMAPVDVMMPIDATMAKLVVTPTGHGFDNNVACAEFCPKEYYINLDGQLAHAEEIWDDQCSENAIFPQGGTWIFDRANWCPGTPAKIFQNEITGLYTPGNSLEINFDVEDIFWTGTQRPGYEMSVQLVTYTGAPTYSNDAGIVDIIRPSLKDDHQRMNPTCDQPIIEVKNEGFDNPLTSFDVVYGVRNGTSYTYSWTGYIAPQASQEIALPNLPFPAGWAGDKVFEASITNLNGTNADANQWNDAMSSPFELSQELGNMLIFELRTNSRPQESAWSLTNAFGQTLFSNTGTQANFTKKDTVYLPYGCYTFSVIDTDGDGLSYWNNNDGAGFVRIKDLSGNVVKSFNPDFGAFYNYNFTTTNNIGIQEDILSSFEVYPNPASDNIRISAELKKQGDITVELINVLGQVKQSKVYNAVNSLEDSWDVSNLAAGQYSLRISSNEGIFVEPLIIQ